MIMRICQKISLFIPLFLFAACGSKSSKVAPVTPPPTDPDFDRESCVKLLSAITEIPEDEVWARYAPKPDPGSTLQVRLKVEVSDGPKQTYNCFVQP